MARHKNSTALFDVIHAAKKPPKSSPSASIPAPRWWGKDKKPLKPSAADPTENVGKQQSWLTAAKRNAGVAVSAPAPVISEDPQVEATSVQDEPAESSYIPADEPPADGTAEPAAPRPRFIDRFKGRSATPAQAVEESVSAVEPQVQVAEPVAYTLPVFDSPAEETAVKPETRPSRDRSNRESMMGIDRTTGDIRFNLSYGGLAAIGFIFLMALAIAFIAGTHSMSTPTEPETAGNSVVHADAPSTSGLAMAVGPIKPTDSQRHVAPEVLEVAPKSVKPVVTSAPAVTSVPLPVKATRDIGMMYVVIQSYPDQEMAQKACDFVNRAGKPCTLVRGLSGWAMRDWYSVVGLQPFKKHDPAMEEEEKAITALGLKFSNKIYNQFQPQGYTWRADSDTNAE